MSLKSKTNLKNISFAEILINGTNFWPAYKHYGYKTSVTCDKCRTDDIQGSIGYGDYDICFQCAAIVADLMMITESDNFEKPECTLLKPIKMNYPPGKK